MKEFYFNDIQLYYTFSKFTIVTYRCNLQPHKLCQDVVNDNEQASFNEPQLY